MTYQPGEPPYVQPQDPWSGPQGTTSAPTEPLPAPVRGLDQFTPGVASPAVWSQETISHSDPLTSSTQPGRSGAGRYVLVGLLVVVLGGAGGYGSWWATSRYAGQFTGPPVTTTSTGSSPESPESPTPRPTEFKYDPRYVETGTCLENRAPRAPRPDMWVVPCDREGTFEVLKVIVGKDIPEDENDNFTDATSEELCSDVPSNAWFGWNSPNDEQDYFYCMRTNRSA
jgi:hypothetical protein